VKCVSEKLKRIGDRYNFRTIFRTKRTSGLHSRKPGRKEISNRRHSVYSIHCECGRSYIGETDRPLAVRFREHRHSLIEGLLGRSKLSQHANEEGHSIILDEAWILEIESKRGYMKYKKSTYMACLRNPNSQPSLIHLPSGSHLSERK
jgi:predicted GIY-YIG superfamily endonuclease